MFFYLSFLNHCFHICRFALNDYFFSFCFRRIAIIISHLDYSRYWFNNYCVSCLWYTRTTSWVKRIPGHHNEWVADSDGTSRQHRQTSWCTRQFRYGLLMSILLSIINYYNLELFCNILSLTHFFWKYHYLYKYLLLVKLWLDWIWIKYH